MKYIICDDSESDRELLKRFIAKHGSVSYVEYTIYEYATAEALLADFTNFSEDACVLFLDIYMDKMSGMEAALKIVESDFRGSIIFTTISVDHAIESYRVAADGYLKKPYAYEDFLLSVNRSYNKVNANLKTLTVTSDRLKHSVYYKDIVYIETGNHCCYISANGDRIKTSTPIAMLEKELSSESSFLRCHRSYIVNLNKIAQTDEDFFIMKNNDKVLYSIRDRAKIKRYIADYFWTQTRNDL